MCSTDTIHRTIRRMREAGTDLLRDFGLLESAVLRPQTSVFGEGRLPEVHTKAAALMHSLVRNHPFVDGN